MKDKIKKYLKLFGKLLISAGALWFVFQKIDLNEIGSLISKANFTLLFPAVLFFVASKLIASVRLNRYFKCIEVNITQKYNLRLYWLGMFYNLFLPGGIGGDGYKVYILNKAFETPLKRVFWAVMLDRFSGLAAIGLLCLCAALFVPLLSPWAWLIALGIPLGLTVYYLFVRFLFPYFLKVFWKTTIEGMGVQIAQLISCVFILLSLGYWGNIPEYLMLFLVSSMVSVLPITIGGAGARELTFLYGSQFLGLDPAISVALSLIFYLISLVVSFAGIVYVIKPPQIEKSLEMEKPVSAY